jgi:catechol 2,3-dioxygenase-like lactoylglutathione lyase family enzyme
MLGERPFYATIPVKDLQEARRFYEDVLGANLLHEDETGIIYKTGGAQFAIYPNQEAAGSAEQTLGNYIVEDIGATVEELRSRGVTFEEYDLPELKTENGIAQLGIEKVAWFKDPDGNILAVTEGQALATGHGS